MSEVTSTAQTFWHVIESNKPSAELASGTCNAVPANVSDPVGSLVGAQGPNRLVWRWQLENLYGIDVVDIAFDLRWEYGARYKGGGAYIPNCYLYVPHCLVRWGFDVDVNLRVHNVSNAGTETAPIARLPITVTGAADSLLNSFQAQWDFQLFGNGTYQVS